MKQILPLMIFLSAAFISQAQDVLFSTDTESLSSGDTVCTTGAAGDRAVIAYTHAINNTSKEMNLRWEITNFDDQSPGWESAICDNNLCYPPSALTNVINGGVPDEPVVLAPNDSTVLQMYIYPQNEKGTGHTQVCISTKEDTDTVLGCLTYKFIIGDATSSVESTPRKTLEVFPNPTTEYFGLTNNGKIKEIQVFNMLGRKQRTFDAGFGKKYFIGDLPAGMYLVALVDKNGKVTKTTRLIKRSYRP